MKPPIDNEYQETLILPATHERCINQAGQRRSSSAIERVDPTLFELSGFGGHIKDTAQNGSDGLQSPISKRKVTLSHLSRATGEYEWYTPERFILSAVECMGCIDLDPASCALANKTVGAASFYSKEDSGLEREWFGNVWLNPPYAAGLIRLFVEAAASKYKKGEYAQACILVNNASDTNWYHRLLNVSSALCVVKGRVKFIDKAGNPSGCPLQGQTAFYIGNNPQAFLEAFKAHGKAIPL